MRDLKLLTQEAFALHVEFAKKMAEAGLNYIVTSTLRTHEEQVALYAQGRQPLEDVNALRKAVGWWAIGSSENVEVTWTMESRHLSGRAFDIALVLPTGKAHWNEKVDANANGSPDYAEAGLIGESVGLVWGGRFRDKHGRPRPDMPHFEAPA